MILSILFAASGGHAFEPHAGWVAFFVLLLLAIAVLPLVREHWWEHNANKAVVAGALSLPVLVLYLVRDWHPVLHSMLEYFSFIVLLWALYTISGGIVLRGSFNGRPRTNLAFLAAGAVLANVFGTTGAAMLLIRPLLRSLERRQHKKHVIIFFIFLVANIGGCLTPLGDPPLFLGYLRGVPFTWTLSLIPICLPTTLLLLGIFYVWDRKAWARETREVRAFGGSGEAFGLDGKLNFLLIAGVLVSTILSPTLEGINRAFGLDLTGYGISGGGPWRELFMIAMGLLSLRLTPRALREENRFTWAAIVEVAVLFAGIFITMIPALQLLRLHGGDLGLTEPWQYLWTAGLLSSFLDNAPTYLVFSTTANAYAATHGLEMGTGLSALAASPDFAVLLKAVSIGAVYMGANTYIGNAPNFMVKVIAETARERRVRMPSFFGYMAWSVGILIPVFVLMTLVAFVWLRSCL